MSNDDVQNTQQSQKVVLDKTVKTFADDTALNDWYKNNHELHDYRVVGFNNNGEILTILHPVHLGRKLDNLKKMVKRDKDQQAKAVATSNQAEIVKSATQLAKDNKMLDKAEKQAEKEYDC